MKKVKQKEFVGIDVSKKTLDVHLHATNVHQKFQNESNGIAALLEWVSSKVDQYCFCFEHCGVYSATLCALLTEQHMEYYVVGGLAVKRSMGIKRGKTDKLDAKALARFAYLHREELSPYILVDESIASLKALLTQRNLFVKQLTAQKTYKREISPNLPIQVIDDCRRQIDDSIVLLKKLIKQVDELIQNVINQYAEVALTYKNLLSIKGVGPVLAVNMIVATNNFKNFDSWRKFASYAGIAPFDHSSGTSIKGKTRVSHMANKRLKGVLSQAAASAIQYNIEMKLYYNHKLAEGKHKMLILNNVKNKLVARMLAVAKRGTHYVVIAKYAA